MVSHALTATRGRTGRCSEPRCLCGVAHPLAIALLRLVARTEARFRHRRPVAPPLQPASTPPPASTPLPVMSPASDVELLLFRDRPAHGRPALNRAPAAAYWPVRQRGIVHR